MKTCSKSGLSCKGHTPGDPVFPTYMVEISTFAEGVWIRIAPGTPNPVFFEDADAFFDYPLASKGKFPLYQQGAAFQLSQLDEPESRLALAKKILGIASPPVFGVLHDTPEHFWNFWEEIIHGDRRHFRYYKITVPHYQAPGG
ncbi:hypothetical protein GCM10027046_23860 [Uliginosibacterium flavum]|uniref:Uncharacterized protein n=1 Tax=Uliginosibacterium flavum TaxID=1396831 RepID=A0ABV2TK73_9RHOO